MANRYYLMKYVGTYRVLPKYDEMTHDFPRNKHGEIAEGYNDIYIACHNGCEIYDYGHEEGNSRVEWLTAYIPSIGRGHNILKYVQEKGIELHNIEETDSEILFRFKAKDIETVAIVMKPKTIGAGISPFSSKNFPKSDVTLPDKELEEYKQIVSQVSKEEMLSIHINILSFLDNVLQKKIKRNNKTYDYKYDMKKMCMFRQPKEFIYTKGYWNEFINYLKDNLLNKGA